MKSNSLLTQAYNKQENITPTVTAPPQPTFLAQLKANFWFILRWFLIGGLTSGIPLAVFVVLYIRKQRKCVDRSSSKEKLAKQIYLIRSRGLVH